jgi:hypothetical protein
MMILHHGWRSSASRRVRLCLEEKGLAYEGHVVDMAKLEHHSPEYLKINPLGVIPTLIHDGKPLHESGTICEYLDESYPDPPLRPDTAYERGQMRNWIRHIDGLIHNLIIFNWRHHLQKVAAQWSDEELAERLKNIPSKERQESWLRVAPTPRKSATRRGPNSCSSWTRWRRRSRPPAGWSARPIRSPISRRCRSQNGSTRRSRPSRWKRRIIPASPNGGLTYRRGRLSRGRISVHS